MGSYPPSLNGSLQNARLSGAANEIVTALELAQIKAMGSGGSTRVTIDDGADSILLEHFEPDEDLLGSETELSENDVESGSFVPMEFPSNPGIDYQIDFGNEERFNGVDIASSTFGANDFVIFSSSGAPSSGGTINISTRDALLVISLDSLSGKVSLSY